jgi:transcriptional regulator with XRE-family HTH domain
MTLEELLSSKGYWLAELQIQLFNELKNYMETHNLNRTQLAEHLGVTKGYVTQVLNGDFDHRLSKLIELSLAIGKVPVLQFKNLDQVIREDKMKQQVTATSFIPKPKTVNWTMPNFEGISNHIPTTTISLR